MTHVVNDFSNLSKTLGISFKNKNLIRQAFVHRSFLNETDEIPTSNERLEFLGDSILSFLVSDYLYLHYPDFPEGELTNIRSSLVKTATLAEVSRKLGLGNYLMLSKGEEEGGGRQNTSILADTFEALLGAIYLDQGLTKVRELVENFLFPCLSTILSQKTYKDAKSVFQELVQDKIKISPVYKVLAESGPDHAKEFKVGVFVNNVLHGEGSGKSKQEAEMKAAKAALEKWRK